MPVFPSASIINENVITRIPSLIALLFVATSTSQHVLAVNTSYIAGDGLHAEGDLPPWSIPNATWSGVMAHPNATGLSYLDAPDVSQPIPNSVSSSWNVSIDVTADIPLVNSPVHDINTSLVFTGTEVNFKALPFSKNPNVMWEACILTGLPGLTDSANEKGQDTDSDCGFIPTDCISSLTVEALQVMGRNNATDGVCDGMGSISMPAQCKDYFDWGFSTGIAFNESQALKGGSIFSYGDIPHERGNLTAYNEAVRKVWSLLIVWRYTARQGGGGNVTNAATAGLQCLRANQVTDGSHVPGNAGVSLRSPILSAWVPVVLGVVALWLA